jgi:hypothetical protein
MRSTHSDEMPSASRSTVRLAIVALLGACALAGCGGSSKQTSTATSSKAPSTVAQEAAATSSSSTAAQTPSATAALTPPGTVLKAGQPATVEFDTTLNNGNNGPSYKLGLTIESIKLGAMSDFNGVSLTGVQKGDVPTYVRLRMTNLSGKSMNTSDQDPADSVQAIDPNGDADGNLTVIGDFPRCPDASTPNPFAAGQSFTTCETYMEPTEATKIGWNGSEATVDSPVIWAPN